MLQRILLETLRAFGLEDQWERFGKGRCEHVCTLVILLGDVFAAAAAAAAANTKKVRGEGGSGSAGISNGENKGAGGGGENKFVLVLDGIDRQKDVSQMLLAALARLGEAVSRELCM